MGHRISLRIEDNLYKEIIFKSRLAGGTLTDYCLFCLRDNQKSIIFKDKKKQNYEAIRLSLIRKISANINQIAKKLNALSKKNITEDYARDLMFETRDKMNLILEILKEI